MIVDLIFLFGLGSISTGTKDKLSGSSAKNNILLLLINSFLNLCLVYILLRILGMNFLVSDTASVYRIDIGFYAIFFGIIFSIALGFIEAYLHKVIEIKIGVKNE
ncbi:hypothetical protein HMPREF1635_06685 [Clostridiales bacterium S5-A14a]|nr:hypothetical protein HMPREF1635_06685 [Clostridiales bacterium S5-A14a]